MSHSVVLRAGVLTFALSLGVAAVACACEGPDPVFVRSGNRDLASLERARAAMITARTLAQQKGPTERVKTNAQTIPPASKTLGLLRDLRRQ